MIEFLVGPPLATALDRSCPQDIFWGSSTWPQEQKAIAGDDRHGQVVPPWRVSAP